MQLQLSTRFIHGFRYISKHRHIFLACATKRVSKGVKTISQLVGILHARVFNRIGDSSVFNVSIQREDNISSAAITTCSLNPVGKTRRSTYGINWQQRCGNGPGTALFVRSSFMSTCPFFCVHVLANLTPAPLLAEHVGALAARSVARLDVHSLSLCG